jgi:serine/threonine protein kinase
VALLRRSKIAQSDFFPGFTEIAEIGIGSLATVYRAREIGTNRLVALKLLNVRDASPRALESFERESIALGAVSSHPNIVTLYRSFRAADGRPVLVLELCRGSMGEGMRAGHGVPVAEVVSMGIKIAGALETAHRAEILHRDVKPQNILITEYGEPALADFGVAMLQSSTQTTAGLFDFTTLHAAPELLEGGETSAATDVYELASSLYQLIAGKSAFRAYDGESPASVILRILRDPVQPLLNAQVPTQLSDLLIYAMSKEKSQRPPTASEFAAELASVEAEQVWPRTQFLIRDPSGNALRSPSVTRIPQRRPRAAALVPPPTAPEPVVLVEPEPVVLVEPEPVVLVEPEPVVEPSFALPPEIQLPAVEPTEPEPEPIAAPALVAPWAPADALHAPDEPPAGPLVPGVDRAAVRIDDDKVASPFEPELDSTAPEAGAPVTAVPTLANRPLPVPPAAAPAYPIPPVAALDAPEPREPRRPLPGPPPDVPTWSFRAPGAMPATAAPAPIGAPQFVSDLSLDPLSLRRRVTIRSGANVLVVDDARILLRVWWRRTEIPWSDIVGFEPRFDGVNASGSGGRLVVLTVRGAVELPATKRAMSDLRYVHALLDAYRIRSQMFADR